MPHPPILRSRPSGPGAHAFATSSRWLVVLALLAGACSTGTGDAGDSAPSIDSSEVESEATGGDSDATPAADDAESITTEAETTTTTVPVIDPFETI
jgi:hypothetical protein